MFKQKKYFVWTYLPAMLIAHLLKLSILCNAQISILEYSKKKKSTFSTDFSPQNTHYST